MTDVESPGHSLGPVAGEADLMRLIEELFPISRSITGDGLRQTLRMLQEHIPIKIEEVASGTEAFDWTVPPEWNVREAYLQTPCGQRIADFHKSNLHLVGYSQPVRRTISLSALEPHLHSDASNPDWIPYRTSYYSPAWGFCLSENLRRQLPDGDYRVVVDTSLNEKGSMSYGELLIPGSSRDEILFSSHVCHPSLANDNLSAVAVATMLARELVGRPLRYSYRFLFAPGTIGAIAWLNRNLSQLPNIKLGVVLALLGNESPLTYKRSPSGNQRIDRVMQSVLQERAVAHSLIDYAPSGYDERQFCSPGIDLPVGRLTRAVEGGYPEYHSSADNLSLLSPVALAQSLDTLRSVVNRIECDRVFLNLSGRGEPQLGRRGLLAGESQSSRRAMEWVLHQSDGEHGLTEISARSGLSAAEVEAAAVRLTQAGLLAELYCEPKLGGRNALRPSLSGDQATAENSDREAAASNQVVGAPSERAREMSVRAHASIPGGCHTYAKGDDQFPENAPPLLSSGNGCRVRDIDGNEFIEFGSGLRSVLLGHAYPPVLDSVQRALQRGSNFTRPASLEVQVAEQLLQLLPSAEMVKFAKNGSDCTTAAIRLARAYTGRSKIAYCCDHPFFSVDDWFIGETVMSAGIPPEIRDYNLPFRYNDIAELEQLLERHQGDIACLIMEAENYVVPEPDYLQQVQALCRQHGIVFILDEMITGFRWHAGGAQTLYDLQPDLSTFGKGIGNGFSVSALAGRQEIMRLGGLNHDQPRVFLLSYTHGAETHCLAAAAATMRIVCDQPVIERLHAAGRLLAEGLTDLAERLEISEFFHVMGRPCNLIFVTKDAAGNRSQAMRTLLLQELIKHGVLAPSLVVNYSHDESALQQTLDAFGKSLQVYRLALRDGAEKYLSGAASRPVFRKFNF